MNRHGASVHRAPHLRCSRPLEVRIVRRRARRRASTAPCKRLRFGALQNIVHFNPRERVQNGFTLLEILTALFIFSILVVTVFGSFSFVLSGSNEMSEKSNLYETARACFQAMSNDLSSIYAKPYPIYHPPDIDDEPDLFHFKGDSEGAAGADFGQLVFASSNHISFVGKPMQGIARIVYYVQVDENDIAMLRRSDHLYPYPDFEASDEDPVLCRNILGLEFSYFDEEGELHETWDSESEDIGYATPKSIGVKITLGDTEQPLTFETRIPLPISREKKETDV